MQNLKKKILVIAVALVLTWSGIVSAYVSSSTSSQVFYVSTDVSNEYEELNEFGITRYEGMAATLKGSFKEAIIRRGTHKVSGPNKVYVDGPGAEGETTLSRKMMLKLGPIVIAAKNNRGPWPTIDMLCIDQKELAEAAGRVEEEYVEVQDTRQVETYREARQYVYAQAPPPPAVIYLPVVYVLFAAFPIERSVSFTHIENKKVTIVNKKVTIVNNYYPDDKHKHKGHGRDEYFNLSHTERRGSYSSLGKRQEYRGTSLRGQERQLRHQNQSYGGSRPLQLEDRRTGFSREERVERMQSRQQGRGMDSLRSGNYDSRSSNASRSPDAAWRREDRQMRQQNQMLHRQERELRQQQNRAQRQFRQEQSRTERQMRQQENRAQRQSRGRHQ